MVCQLDHNFTTVYNVIKRSHSVTTLQPQLILLHQWRDQKQNAYVQVTTAAKDSNIFQLHSSEKSIETKMIAPDILVQTYIYIYNIKLSNETLPNYF